MAMPPGPPQPGPTILDRPFVRFGREITGDLEAALRREWLVSNGLGSYASGTVAGVATRRYHGLLVAALEPPVERTVLVAGTLEWLLDGDRRVALSTLERTGGRIDPTGYREMESFELEGTVPTWTFAAGDLLLERRVWMPAGEQATWLTFRMARGDRPVRLEVRPLVVHRPFHELTVAGRPSLTVMPGPRPSVEVRFGGRSEPVSIIATSGEVAPDGTRHSGLLHREERARGLDHRSAAHAAALFTLTITPGETAGIRLGLGPPPAGAELDPEASLRAERARQAALLERCGVGSAAPATPGTGSTTAPPLQQLVLAADQFLVDRRPAGRTVIAGYHWFNDWGRDTMIALPGLALATGRPEEAAAILRSFAPYVRDGLLPNNFPDRAGVEPGYNTVDASLWYVVAIGRYEAATGDHGLVADLLPSVREIVDRHVAGTRYGIGMDPADALLRAGEPGSQLTWMDARIGEVAFTPRIGKPVEINALWYNALRLLASWLGERNDPGAGRYEELAGRARASFAARFAAPDRDHLADVVDGPDGDDLRVRPNQVLALALPYPVLDNEPAARVLAAAGRSLLTSLGLRSLSTDDPAYRGDYGGDAWRRDSGYHQGPVWTWLVGAWIEAHLRVHGDVAAARSFLRPFEDHLRDAGLGSVSEILEGDAPHAPRGAAFQAWGVAEVLRAWRLLDDAGAR
jgi:glycogen debranching enzyme